MMPITPVTRAKMAVHSLHRTKLEQPSLHLGREINKPCSQVLAIAIRSPFPDQFLIANSDSQPSSQTTANFFSITYQRFASAKRFSLLKISSDSELRLHFSKVY